MSFDEGLLDEPQLLERADRSGLLRALATAGPQVRRAGETAGEFDVVRLREADRPRAVLVATDADSAVARVVVRLAEPRSPVVHWYGADLPRWAGPADALLVASLGGRDPRLVELTAQAAHRGLAMAVVAPAGSPLAGSAGRAPVHELPRDLHPRATRWTLLVPLLQALDALGLYAFPAESLLEVADALDTQAEACRPHGDAFTNPAKSLAVEFAESDPVVAGAGPMAATAARTIAESLHRLAAVSAVDVALPGDLDGAVTLVRGAVTPDDDDLFRDRVEDSGRPRRPRLLVIGDEGTPEDAMLVDRPSADAQLVETAARQAADVLRRLAHDSHVPVSGVDLPHGDALVRFAAATAFGDFTAVYLALASGLDPGAPHDWERPPERHA